VTHDGVNPELAITSPVQDLTVHVPGIALSGTVHDLTTVEMVASCPTASVGTVVYPTMTSWTVDVTNLSQGVNAVTVSAADQAGNETTVVRNVVYDTTPPAVTVNAVASPTDQRSQTISGGREEYATVSVACPTAAVGAVIYPTDDTWEVGLTDLSEGDNLVTVTAVDASGNTSQAVTTTIVVDTAALRITNAWPRNKSIIASANVGYTLSEAAQSGKATFTRTGGAEDILSPHVRDLSGEELDAGIHTVDTGFTLIDGAFYTVSFEATDLAGNTATVSNAMVFHDGNYGVGPVGNVDNEDGLNIVNDADVARLKAAMGSRPGDPDWDPASDLDRNNVIDQKDLMILMQRYGASHP
jgi:hypothetical protein